MLEGLKARRDPDEEAISALRSSVAVATAHLVQLSADMGGAHVKRLVCTPPLPRPPPSPLTSKH